MIIKNEYIQKTVGNYLNPLENKIDNILNFIEMYKHVVTSNFVTEFELKKITSIIRKKISIGATHYNNKINKYSEKIKSGFKLTNNEILDYQHSIRKKHYFDELKYYIDDIVISDIVFIDGFVNSIHQNPELIKILWNLNDDEVEKVVEILDNL